MVLEIMLFINKIINNLTFKRNFILLFIVKADVKSNKNFIKVLKISIL